VSVGALAKEIELDCRILGSERPSASSSGYIRNMAVC
jgi:hypothetical protein